MAYSAPGHTKECVEPRCQGEAADLSVDQCLRHLSPRRRRQTLEGVGGEINLRKVAVTGELWDEIREHLRHVPPQNHVVNMDHATVTESVSLIEIEALGQAYFRSTRFEGRVDATGVTFLRPVTFNSAQFRDSADFSGAQFRQGCSFLGADFLAEVRFRGSAFNSGASFESATFVGPAAFDQVTALGHMSFNFASFRNSLDVRRSKFRAGVRWRDAFFTSIAPTGDDPTMFAEAIMPPAAEDRGESVLTSTQSQPLRPRLFVASAQESRNVAVEILAALQPWARAMPWWQAFQVGRPFVSDLLKEIGKSDFAVFVVTADDRTEIRGNQRSVARDNVIFELGLAYGALGEGRVFMLKPNDLDLHLPTDVLGVTTANFRADEFADDPRTSLSGAAADIGRAIEQHGPR